MKLAEQKQTDLIQEALCKADAVFDGNEGDAPLLPPVLLVELVDSCAAGAVVRLELALLPAAQHVVRAELQLVGGRRRSFVHVHLPNLQKYGKKQQSEHLVFYTHICLDQSKTKTSKNSLKNPAVTAAAHKGAVK